MKDRFIKDYIFTLELFEEDGEILCHLNLQYWSVSIYKQLLEEAKEAIARFPHYRFIANVPNSAHKHHHSIIEKIGFEKTAQTILGDDITDIYLLTDKFKLFRKEKINDRIR